MTTSAAFSIVSPYNVRNVQRQACVRTGWTCPITPNSASGTLARLPNARISLLKQELEQLLLASLAKLTGSVLTEMPAPPAVVVERTRDSGHGEFTTNLALRLAKAARRNPRELAAAIVAALPASPLLSRTEVAGAGFINFHLAPEAYARELASIHALGSAYGESRLGQGERVLVEFVSANPTGPLHVGHGRQAAYGATLANILAAVGFEVAREYYINDAGRQMDILAVSTWLRYLGLCGEELPFPQNGYRGDYLRPPAHKLKAAAGEQLRRPAASVLAQLPQDAPAGDKEAYIDALIVRARELLGVDGFGRVLELSLGEMLADIRNDLSELDRKSTRLNSSHVEISYAVFCLKKKKKKKQRYRKHTN